MTTPAQPAGPKINIPEGTEPLYANLARISHSPADIVIDFAQILPGENDRQHPLTYCHDPAQRKASPACSH